MELVVNKKAHDTILRECLSVLTANGIEPGPAVRALLEFFFSTDRHLTLNDIEQLARQRRLEIGRNEIQRTLDLLLEYGFAARRQFSDGKQVYEHVHLGEHHDHLYCIRCGAIFEFFSPHIEQLQDAEARKRGFHAFSHKMHIHGICARCYGDTAQQTLPLAMLEAGGEFRVVEVARGGHGHGQRHLMDMGIAPGCSGAVISNAGGMIVVNVCGARIALGRGQGMRVQVMLTN